MNIIGVTITDNLSMHSHISTICQSASQNLFAIKLIHSRGLNLQSIHSLSTALILPKLTYASAAWWGFTNASDRARMQAVINKAIRWGLYDQEAPSVDEVCNKHDLKLILTVLNNPSHSLHSLLPPIKTTGYDMRKRAHNRWLIVKENPYTEKNFICRMLYELYH